LNEYQDASTLGATARWHRFFDSRIFTRRFGFDGTGAKQFSGSVEERTMTRAEQAVVSHFDEPVGQHVLKKPADEFFGTHRTGRKNRVRL
jgi:hypothetical protein